MFMCCIHGLILINNIFNYCEFSKLYLNMPFYNYKLENKTYSYCTYTFFILSKFFPNDSLYYFPNQIKSQKSNDFNTQNKNFWDTVCAYLYKSEKWNTYLRNSWWDTSKEWVTCTSTILKQQNIFHLIVKLVHWPHCKIIGWSTKVVIVLVKYMPVVRGKFPTVLTVAVFGRRNNVHWAWCWWHPWLIWRGVWGLLVHSPFYLRFRHKNIQQGVITKSIQMFKISRKLDFS